MKRSSAVDTASIWADARKHLTLINVYRETEASRGIKMSLIEKAGVILLPV